MMNEEREMMKKEVGSKAHFLTDSRSESAFKIQHLVSAVHVPARIYPFPIS